MNPGILKASELPIYKGARWAHTLTMENVDDGTPADLTGLGPFSLVFKRINSDAILATGTATVDADPQTGIIEVVLTPAQTEEFAIGEAAIGMVDANEDPWIVGVCAVRKIPKS